MPDEPEARKPANKQQSGMEGVFLVCAELTRRGYIASPTARNSKGADILVTTDDCTRSFAVQVKTNTKETSFWLVDKPDCHCSPSLIYVLVNLNDHKRPPDYYIVPSPEVRRATKLDARGDWPSFYRAGNEQHKDNWRVFETGGWA